jgi:hypothetical protein
MLRQDHVNYQQNMLQLKKNCTALKKGDDLFRKDFEGTKPRLNSLQ